MVCDSLAFNALISVGGTICDGNVASLSVPEEIVNNRYDERLKGNNFHDLPDECPPSLLHSMPLLQFGLQGLLRHQVSMAIRTIETLNVTVRWEGSTDVEPYLGVDELVLLPCQIPLQ